MAIKDLLVHLEAGEAGAATIEFALSLATQTGAHLTAAGIALQYMPMSSIEDAGTYEVFARLTDESRADVEAAYKVFAAAAPANVQTDFVLIETLAQLARDKFGELGRHFDISIVGQGNPEIDDEQDLMVQGALLVSGKPVFVVPFIHKGPAKLGKAMACWDGSAPAARAIDGAMPLLQRAGRVELVRIEDKGEKPEELPGFNMTRHLARHGVTASLRELPPAKDIGAALLSYAADSGADYVVMGGYGHWKMTELVFGGATRTILSSMTLPVFMAH